MTIAEYRKFMSQVARLLNHPDADSGAYTAEELLELLRAMKKQNFEMNQKISALQHDMEPETLYWFLCNDGDGQMSCIMQAYDAEHAAERWNDSHNPCGLEVPGHPWLDGKPKQIDNPEEYGLEMHEYE